MPKEVKLSKEHALFVIVLCLCLVWVGVVYATWIFGPSPIGEWGAGAMRYSVSSTPDDRLVLRMDPRSIDYARNPFLVVRFYSLDGFPEKRPAEVWRVVSKGERSHERLTSLTYGLCPPGYDQPVPAEPLLTGHYYLFDATAFVIKKTGKCQFELVSRKRYLELINRTGIEWPLLP